MRYVFGMIGLLMAASVSAAPIGSAFTYQGQLNLEGAPVDTPQDFEFGLYDAQVSGAQIGTTVTLQAVPVEKGLFNVRLDFGSQAFGADARFLHIQVKPAEAASYASLAPRVPITPVPVALTAISALSAQSADMANSVAPSSIGTAALQPGSVNWGQLAPDLFPVHLAVMMTDAYVSATPQNLNFDAIVHSSPAFLSWFGNIVVNAPGLYRIDLALTPVLWPYNECSYAINVNGSPVASFSEAGIGMTTNPQVTQFYYLELNPGDAVSISVSSSDPGVTIMGSPVERFSYMSIMRLK